jgi:hypothetical protein
VSEGVTRGDAGPGVLETSIVFGLAALITIVIVGFLGGPLADVIGVFVDAAHGGG